MKLKEKLAEEYVRATGMIIDSPYLADYLEAKEHYLAGFEKAREMASGYLAPMESVSFFDPFGKPIWTSNAMKRLKRDILDLGEEEVKE